VTPDRDGRSAHVALLSDSGDAVTRRVLDRPHGFVRSEVVTPADDLTRSIELVAGDAHRMADPAITVMIRWLGRS